MPLTVLLLKLTWLSLQLVDTLKTIKKPALRKSKVKAVDEDGEDISSTPAVPQRTRMSTLKRDQWRRLLKSWIVWILFSYVERFTDHTFGMVMPFYNQVKIVFLLALSIPRSSTLPYIYDRFLQPRLKRHTRTVDLSTSLLMLIGQYLLQLVLCLTVVPILTAFERLRSFWRSRWSADVEQNRNGSRGSTRPSPPPPPGGFRTVLPETSSSTPVRPRKKSRKSVLDNVLEFSLGTPRTLRQTVHEAKALYDGPAARPGKKVGDGESKFKVQAEKLAANKLTGTTGKVVKARDKRGTTQAPLDGLVGRTGSGERSKSAGLPQTFDTAPKSRAMRAEQNPTRLRAVDASRPVRVSASASTTAARAAPMIVRNPLAIGIPTLPSRASLRAAGPSQPVTTLPPANAPVRIGSHSVEAPAVGREAILAQSSVGLDRLGLKSSPIEVVDETAEDMDGIEYTGTVMPAARTVPSAGATAVRDESGVGSAQGAFPVGGKVTPRKRKGVDTAAEARRPKVRKVDQPPESLHETKLARAAPPKRKPVETSRATSGAKVKTTTKPAGRAREPGTAAAENVRAVPDPDSRTNAEVPEGRTLRSARRKLPIVETEEGVRVPVKPVPEPEPELQRPKRRPGPTSAPIKRTTRNLGLPQRPERK